MDSTNFREPPVAGDEIDLLLGILDRTRSVLAWKCGGLDTAGLQARLGPSAVTLGGLLKHLARVEDDVFSGRLFGRPPAPPWDASDSDSDWRMTAEDTPERLFALWQRAVESSRANVAAALTHGDMGQPVHLTNSPNEHANLRRIVVDMIDEYARHNGQADLIRESVDGLVGEDPPQPG